MTLRGLGRDARPGRIEDDGINLAGVLGAFERFPHVRGVEFDVSMPFLGASPRIDNGLLHDVLNDLAVRSTRQQLPDGTRAAEQVHHVSDVAPSIQSAVASSTVI